MCLSTNSSANGIGVCPRRIWWIGLDVDRGNYVRQTRALVEYDPLYCGVIIRRWQTFAGKHAVHADTGVRFEDIESAAYSSAPPNQPRRRRAAR